MIKFDSHSHLGQSYLGPNCDLPTYIAHAVERLNVHYTVTAPVACPEETQPDGTVIRPCIWKLDQTTGNLVYVKQICDSNGEVLSEEPAYLNPYSYTNSELMSLAYSHNTTNKHQILVMPLHHPLLDTEAEVSRLLHEEPSIALKIHGIATYSGPSDVPQTTIHSLRSLNKPVIVHTDYHAEPQTLIEQAYRMNDPYNWIRWAIDTDVKVFITHAARLSKAAIRLASGRSNILIGLAPDILLEAEPDRLAFTSESHSLLADLFALVPPEQLAFDIDYRWNVSERNNWDATDWDMTQRIEEAGMRGGWTMHDFENVYFNNASRFFNLED